MFATKYNISNLIFDEYLTKQKKRVAITLPSNTFSLIQLIGVVRRLQTTFHTLRYHHL